MVVNEFSREFKSALGHRTKRPYGSIRNSLENSRATQGLKENEKQVMIAIANG